jgi:hypothetical protein
VARTQMKEDWTWGKAPHDRANPAPKVNSTSLYRHPFYAGNTSSPILDARHPYDVGIILF